MHQTSWQAQWAHIAWADHEALGGAITEIDTTAVLARHDKAIDNPGVEMDARTRGVWIDV
jgi:hypothetical protein